MLVGAVGSALLLAGAATAQASGTPGTELPRGASVRVMRKVHTEMMSVVFDRLRENGVTAPNGTLEMSADSSRAHVLPRLTGSTLPDSALNGVLEIMQAAVAEWPADLPVMASFRLDAEAALIPADSMEPGSPEFVEEPPHPRNTLQFYRMMQRLISASGVTPQVLERRPTARLAMLVGPDGRVAAVEVEHLTGVAALDGLLLPLAYELHFYPALRGGRGVSVWVSMPLDFGRK